MVNPLLIMAVLGLLTPPATTLISDNLNANFPVMHEIVKVGEKQLMFAGLKTRKSIVESRIREARILQNNPVALGRTLKELNEETDKLNDIDKEYVSRKNVEVLTTLRDKLPQAWLITLNSGVFQAQKDME